MTVLCVRACLSMRMVCVCVPVRVRVRVVCVCVYVCALVGLYSQWSYIATRCLVVVNVTFLGWCPTTSV